MTTDYKVDDTTRFFLESGSPQLEKIYYWARARYAAPWAVFGAVLLRVAASVGPNIQLPGLIGGRASLNLLCAFVSASGGGKGISDKVARLAWPTPILELPIGSGEGIAAAFKKPDKPDADDEPITAAIFNVPEIDTLAGIAGRQGSILLAQLKSMAMGEQLGQSNASKATSRIVPAHAYRCCMSVGAQPGHTGVLFDDTTGGTPQRFLWFPTTDSAMPDTQSPDPEPMDTALPPWASHADVEIQYGPEEIAQTVIAAHLARQRGQAEALDGHAMLTRCKVAAVLAIMHQRSVVGEWDWLRSADVMAISDQTRDWIVDEAKSAARAKVRERAVSRAKGEEFASDQKHARAKSAILRWLERDGELAANQLRSKLKADVRDHFGAAVAELAAEGWITEIRVDRGSRYRVSAEVQGVPAVQGSYQQFSGGVPEVQGVPRSNVTELDTRRSQEADDTKLTARDWFAKHIQSLQSAGHDTARAFAVYEAGCAQGFEMATLRNAASSSGLVHIARREGKAVIWCLHPDVCDHPPARQTSHWLRQWLAANSRPDGVPPAEAISAGAQQPEKYTRAAVVRAMQSMPEVESTGTGPASRWRITLAQESSA